MTTEILKMPSTSPTYIAEFALKNPGLSEKLIEEAIAGIYPESEKKINGSISHAAMEYIERGFSIIPLKRDKKPALAWTEFQNRRATEAEAKAWFANYNYNLGIITGKLSGLTVVDFDTLEAIKLAKERNFPLTPMVKTSKGYHAYCRYEVGHRNFQKRADLPGIDLRAEGGYVVAPPSRHTDGVIYQWVKSKTIDDLELAEVPEWILAKKPEERTPLECLFKGANEGSRNEALTRVAGSVISKGMDYGEALQFCLTWNEKNCPPLDEKEVETTVKSIWQRHGQHVIASAQQFDNNRSSEKNRPLVVVNYGELIRRDIPKREAIFSPWLLNQSLNMIYAWRGVGKTWVALWIAYTVASGGKFLKWEAAKSVKVLYLDGEMPAYTMKERLLNISDTEINLSKPENLRILTPDFQPEGMPDLSTPKGQEEINALIEPDTGLIIVDNISSLCRSGKENESESWMPVQAWALQQRAAGRSVLFIHHAGKGGAQRGSSKREDLLDTVINLKRPSDYKSEQGACFEVHFEKARHIFGDETGAFLARLETDNMGKPTWTCRDLEGTTFDKVIELSTLGMKQNEIANELGINRSTVSRHYNKGLELGKIQKGKK